MVSQMARAKNLGEPFMAHLENSYNIPWIYIYYYMCTPCMSYNVVYK